MNATVRQCYFSCFFQFLFQLLHFEVSVIVPSAIVTVNLNSTAVGE